MLVRYYLEGFKITLWAIYTSCSHPNTTCTTIQQASSQRTSIASKQIETIGINAFRIMYSPWRLNNNNRFPQQYIPCEQLSKLTYSIIAMCPVIRMTMTQPLFKYLFNALHVCFIHPSMFNSQCSNSPVQKCSDYTQYVFTSVYN